MILTSAKGDRARHPTVLAFLSLGLARSTGSVEKALSFVVAAAGA